MCCLDRRIFKLLSSWLLLQRNKIKQKGKLRCCFGGLPQWVCYYRCGIGILSQTAQSTSRERHPVALPDNRRRLRGGNRISEAINVDTTRIWGFSVFMKDVFSRFSLIPSLATKVLSKHKWGNYSPTFCVATHVVSTLVGWFFLSCDSTRLFCEELSTLGNLSHNDKTIKPQFKL